VAAVLVLNADLGPLHWVVIPRSRGGRNAWSNTVAACGDCNQQG
jgi:hypothetical protein